jgi:hypothetical protein
LEKNKQNIRQVSEDSIYENGPEVCDNYKLLINDCDKFAYTYYYEFGPLVQGDFFMGRSLLAEYLKIEPSFKNKIVGDPEQKAKLTIVFIYLIYNLWKFRLLSGYPYPTSLPYPTLPYPTFLPYFPTLPYLPTLPYPTLPYPTLP